MDQRVRIIVKGRVQGVYYRYNARLTAQALGLSGWARNLPDGSVEILCEGPSDQIRALSEWCRIGPRGAFVEEVATRAEEYTGEFSSFEIRY